ncbi:transmembrane protein 106C-like [Neolamprologus brichardi]|nr:transmembrane protein 106C-like [Neolamprologus brichardi]
MGTRWSRSGSSQSLLTEEQRVTRYTERRDSDNDSLDGLVRREDIAQFPYVEFTGRDSVTCPTCQGTGRIPSEQVNELVALIPYNDQRLQPQRTCAVVSDTKMLASDPLSPVSLSKTGCVVGAVFLFLCVSLVLYFTQSTLNFSNPNFFSVHVQSISSQVLYMKTVIGTELLHNVTTVLPLSACQVNYTVSVEIGSNAPYVYTLCTMSSIKVHNILVLMQTSVKTSYMVRTSQNSLEAYRYIDCGSNTTYQQPENYKIHSSGDTTALSLRHSLL